MAIVINGSGTITGISVGGLPDGTVDAGTVAADVATQAELDAAGVGGATGVDFNDNTKARFGTGNDLEIFHDGTQSYIDNNAANLLIMTEGGIINLQKNSSEYLARFHSDGASELYHNNSKKLSTTADGIEINGEIEMGGNLHITGESGSDRLTINEATGAVWIDGSCSAASFIDRTPYPETLQLAYDVINSHHKLPDGEYKADDQSKQLDHTKLHEYVKGEEKSRNMSGVISCLVEVIKDLSTKNTALEVRITALEA